MTVQTTMRKTTQQQEAGKQQKSPPPPPRSKADEAMARPPVDKPPFTLADLRRAIPPHCFQRSLLRSSAYLLHDLAVAGALLYAAVAAIPSLPPLLRYAAAWPLYWAAQGSVMFGVWVIAHECGHGSFSRYPVLNDALGLALHTCLLAPYFSWKYSHQRHHANTASLDRDEVFVPKQKPALPWYSPLVYGRDNPAARLALLAVQLTVGWPMYLAFNTWGRAYPRFACHFDPFSPIYAGRRERAQIALSDAAMLAASLALYRLAAAHGLWPVLALYGVPLLVCNAWLVVVTYLHHTHAALPHYGGGEWDWMRGALATVDRDYGFLNRVFHHIADTHVAHHLFPAIPHYHAVEATAAIRPVLGDYYRADGTPIARSLWREAKECIYVQRDDHKQGVFWYSDVF